MENKRKFCAFGIIYCDKKGVIIEESENFYIVLSNYYPLFSLALKKDDSTKVFDTVEERDSWIESQHYQYGGW